MYQYFGCPKNLKYLYAARLGRGGRGAGSGAGGGSREGGRASCGAVEASDAWCGARAAGDGRGAAWLLFWYFEPAANRQPGFRRELVEQTTCL